MVTRHSRDKAHESDIREIFDLTSKFLPDEDVCEFRYSQGVSARGDMESMLYFERRIAKSTLETLNDVREYLDNKLPTILKGYLKNWDMRDENTHLLCKYHILIPNAPDVVASIRAELFSRYSKQFDADVDRTLKSK